MAAILKFRRGSGVPTLTISEPFWNETDTTLNIGVGDGSYVTLVNLNTVNQGSITFDGDINADHGNFSGSVSIEGNLFVGGTITLGDGGDEIVVGAPFSGSIIPSIGSVFDIGSNTKHWKDLYVDNIYSTNNPATSIEWVDIDSKPALVSGSSQIDHNLTANFISDKHINHSTLGITAGLGLEGGGILTTTRIITLATGSIYFISGVTDILDDLGVISGSGGYSDADNLAYLNSIAVLSGSLDNRTIDGLILTNVTASGSFSGSYVGDGSLLTGVVTGSGTFAPTVADAVTMPEAHGGIDAGTSAGTLKGNTYDEMFSDILFPTVLAYIQLAKSVSVSTIPTSTQEVGTNLKPSLNVTYNPGNIYNGDDTDGPALTGNASGYDYKLPSGTSDIFHNTTSNSDSHTFTGDHFLILGNNRWSVEVSHSAGSGAYYDNKGVAGINLDASRVLDTVVKYTNYIYGRYYAWDGYGLENSEPTGSAGVRALVSNQFLDSSNTGTFSISIPSGTQSVYFYTPAGKTITVNYVESSNADVTGTFTETQFNVQDAGGTNVLYDSWVTFIGTTGYPATATYTVTIS